MMTKIQIRRLGSSSMYRSLLIDVCNRILADRHTRKNLSIKYLKELAFFAFTTSFGKLFQAFVER